ncbi:interleukin-8-like [Pristis pectinata]|uniref:interleukin-8-like n=1 Tax=Pristis pectinata TaxID=685728 RepID=UPI00223C9079|nr:interleukin-8-like [Pristis pectinata]
MNYSIIFTLLLLLGNYAAFFMAVPVNNDVNIRCMCRNYERKQIFQNIISDIDIYPSGKGCNVTEVIAKLTSNNKICLHGSDKWVKDLIDKLLNTTSMSDTF